jgi:hypothetical protein
MVALTSAGNICMHEAGCVSIPYVCDVPFDRYSCAVFRNVSQWSVRALVLIEYIKTDICVFVPKCRGIINLCGKVRTQYKPSQCSCIEAVGVNIFALCVISKPISVVF